MSDVVERAARRVLARERWTASHRGDAFDLSADDVLTDALPDDAPLWRWAELARAALQRARELRGEPPAPDPPEPRSTPPASGIPAYRRRSGGDRYDPV